jgi:hypothetical protein
VRVQVVGGSPQSVCACGSWLIHWQQHSGCSVPGHCPEFNCMNRAEVGALVEKEGAADGKRYVVPLCSACASRTGEAIAVSDAIRLVPADSGENCG